MSLSATHQGRTRAFCLIVLLAVLFAVPFADAQEQRTVEEDDLLLESLLEAPVSAAAKYEQTAREAPASVTVITAEDIASHGYRTLAEALQDVRGLYVSDDRSSTYIGVRGFGRLSEYNNRVVLLINGHVLNESMTGYVFYDNTTALSMDIVERIEVVRGPGSALYGTGAMLAVINVVTTPGSLLGSTLASIEGGSYRHLEANLSTGKTFENGLELLVSGRAGRRDGTDFELNRQLASQVGIDTIEDLDWERFGNVYVDASYTSLRVQGFFSMRESADPTAPRGAYLGTGPIDVSLHQRVAFLDAEYSLPLSLDKQLITRVFGDHVLMTTNYPYAMTPQQVALAPEEGADGIMNIADTGLTYNVGTEARFLWDPTPNMRFTLGGEYRWGHLDGYREDATGITTAAASGTLSTGGFFGQADYQITPHLAVTAGLRFDYFDSKSGFAPRGALVYTRRATTLKLLYGEAYRAPSFFEKNFAGRSFAPNRNLSPERLRTAELIWEQQLTPWLAGTATLYAFRLDDLIRRRFAIEANAVQYQNVDKAEVEGVEVELDARLPGGLRAMASYALQNSRDPATDLQLINSPTYLVRSRLAVPLLDGFTAALLVRHESGRTTHFGSKTEPFTVADVQLSTRPLFEKLTLSARLLNAFDAAYSFPSSTDHRQAAIPQDGRRVFVRAAYRF